MQNEVLEGAHVLTDGKYRATGAAQGGMPQAAGAYVLKHSKYWGPGVKKSPPSLPSLPSLS